MAEEEDELNVVKVSTAEDVQSPNAEIGEMGGASRSTGPRPIGAHVAGDNPIERRVAELFVNREHEQKRFQRMLEMRESPIFMVSGASGIGKTWLVSRLARASVRQGCYAIILPCSDVRTPAYESIIDAVTAAIGADMFVKVTAARNFVGEPAASSGSLATDSRERDRQTVLTTAFFEDLARIGQEKRVVIFFDAVEKMTTPCRAWLTDRLLPALIDGRLTNVFIGIFGQAPMRLGPSIEPIAIAMQLQPFGVEDVVDYLQKIGVDPKVSHPLAALLMTVSRGIPHDLAMHVMSHRDALIAVAT